jgi:hypothetical protein
VARFLAVSFPAGHSGHSECFRVAPPPAADDTGPPSPCEEVFRRLRYSSGNDKGYYSALVRMFEQALTDLLMVPEPERMPLMARLDQVRAAGQKLS